MINISVGIEKMSFRPLDKGETGDLRLGYKSSSKVERVKNPPFPLYQGGEHLLSFRYLTRYKSGNYNQIADKSSFFLQRTELLPQKQRKIFHKKT